MATGVAPATLKSWRREGERVVDRFSNNLLFGALAPEDQALLSPAMRRVKLERFGVLAEANEPIQHLYWLEGGLASVISGSRDETSVEMALIGLEGLTGTAALLGAGRTPNRTVVQIDGTTALEITAEELLAAMNRSDTLRATLLRYVQTVLVQTGSNAVNNVSDRLDARLARWLLMCHDRVEEDEITVTHHFMAGMIGTQRSAVTHALHVLEGERMIRARRGSISILDRRALEVVAGAGYGDAESEYRRLIAPFGKSLLAS
jgi:CRP-like cAMP-binding protein